MRQNRFSLLAALLLVAASVAAGCLGAPAPGAARDDSGDGGSGGGDGESDEPSPVAPRFTEVAMAAGAPGCGAGGGEGRGAAWGDYDGDGDADLYTTCDGANALYRNEGDGAFTDVTAEAGVGGGDDSYGAAWVDFDGDGCLDLHVANGGPGGDGEPAPDRLYRGDCAGGFADVAEAVGLAGAGHSTGVAWADYDLDGDLDAFVTAGAGAAADGEAGGARHRLYRNGLFAWEDADEAKRRRGNATFTDVAEAAGVAGAGASGGGEPSEREAASASWGALWLDYDNDGWMDLFVSGGAGHLYRNRGDGAFDRVTAEAGLDGGGASRGAAAGDADGDGDLDLYVASGGRNRLWRYDHHDRAFRDGAGAAAVADGGQGWGVAFADLNNDGHRDLLVANGGASDGGGSRVFLGAGGGAFVDASNATGLRGGGLAVAVADYDLDGDQDAYVTTRDAGGRLYRNDGPAASWLRLHLRANQSAPGGVGAQVWVVDGNDTLLEEARAGGGLLAGHDGAVHFGLGARGAVDIVEVRWPSGNRQVLKAVAANQTLVVEERNTEKTSCPLLFVVDPDGSVRFVSDTLGAAYSGWLVAPGTYKTPDPTELVRIGDLRATEDGHYELRLLEALEETNFLDLVELVAVDHPADVTVHPDERFKVLEPYPAFGLVASRAAAPVAAAWDHAGADVTGLVGERDRRYVGVPALPPPTYDGYAERHTLTVDLGEQVVGAERVQLLFHGWIYYPMVVPDLVGAGTPLPIEPPRLEALDPATGEWVLVTEDMGFPAGLPKTMTYDLTGRLPEGAHVVRVTTNLQVYWDELRVDTTPVADQLRVTRVAPSEATLRFGGYPAFETPDGRPPGVYNYSRRASVHVWDEISGNYTRYGDVTPLLRSVDDMFVVFGHGDEVVMRFNASALPPVPEGWARTFFMYGDAFFKDTEPFNAFPRTVEPLPWHGMSNYPPGPGEAYPDDGAHRAYLREWNTRVR